MRLARALQLSLWDWLFLALGLGLLLAVSLTFQDYGITWDEPAHASYGDLILRWYGSLFGDSRALNFSNLHLYGGFFEVLAQSAARVSPMGLYETRHLVNAWFGLAAIIGTFLLGRYLAGPLAGFLAAMFLALTPRFYGHAFNNPKDIPFAALHILALYLTVRAIQRFPDIVRPWVLGVMLGLMLGVRFGGAFVLSYPVAAFLGWFLLQRFTRTKEHKPSMGFLGAASVFARKFLLVSVVAYACALAWWPAAQSRPLRQPYRTLMKSARFTTYNQPVFFEGRVTSSRDIPWHYVSKWAAITLPEFYFGALGVGSVLACKSLWQSRAGGGRVLEYGLTLLSICLPVAAVAASRAVVYDEIRQLLFIVPPLAVLAGAGVARLAQGNAHGLIKAAVFPALILSMGVTAADMIELHPYKYVYFNRLWGGGLAAASNSYETDYWGSSYREGARWVAGAYPLAPGGRKLRVASCSEPNSTTYFLPPDRFAFVGSFDNQPVLDDRPDLFLATTRWGCHEAFQGRVVHVVQRQQTPLLFVKEIGEEETPRGRFAGRVPVAPIP